MAIGALFVLDPLLRKKDADQPDADFLPLGIGPDALPSDGTPQQVTVQSDKQDAWNYYPRQRIGTIWIRKSTDGQIIAYSAICPHLGCSVEYRSTNKDFFCPCHNSNFDLAGERLNQIPPRPLDRLDVETRDGKIWVRFEKFRGGIEDKNPV